MKIECSTDSNGQFKHVIKVGGHTLYADKAVADGGTGSGPGPHEYFDASLAACKAMTALVYAKARNIALDKVHVELERDDSQERQGTYVLKVKVGFEGALSDEERAKLLEITTRCPIHKLMTTATVDIQTTSA